MSADRLREAAALLRERAGDATPGPWDHVVGAGGDVAWVERRNIETVFATHDIGTSAYIAMMHPPVALALADWLDHAAEASDYGEVWPDTHEPHAVADAILGGDR